jgi:hypothetical protein
MKSSSKSYKPIFLLTSRILLFISFLAFVSCENDIEVIKSFSGDNLLPSQSMINAEIYYTDSARLQLRITAPEIHNYTNVGKNILNFHLGSLLNFSTDTEMLSHNSVPGMQFILQIKNFGKQKTALW